MEVFIIMTYFESNESGYAEVINPCYRQKGFRSEDEAKRFIEQDEFLIDLIENEPEYFVEIMPLTIEEEYGDDV